MHTGLIGDIWHATGIEQVFLTMGSWQETVHCTSAPNGYDLVPSLCVDVLSGVVAELFDQRTRHLYLVATQVSEFLFKSMSA